MFAGEGRPSGVGLHHGLLSPSAQASLDLHVVPLRTQYDSDPELTGAITVGLVLRRIKNIE
jgi:hypothetical protein